MKAITVEVTVFLSLNLFKKGRVIKAFTCGSQPVVNLCLRAGTGTVRS